MRFLNCEYLDAPSTRLRLLTSIWGVLVSAKQGKFRTKKLKEDNQPEFAFRFFSYLCARKRGFNSFQ
jgi:hypothetical protein